MHKIVEYVNILFVFNWIGNEKSLDWKTFDRQVLCLCGAEERISFGEFQFVRVFFFKWIPYLFSILFAHILKYNAFWRGGESLCLPLPYTKATMAVKDRLKNYHSLGKKKNETRACALQSKQIIHGLGIIIRICKFKYLPEKWIL